MKNFDEWNAKKKDLDSTDQRRFYHEREIWWCRLGLNVGFEQDGKGENFERPVLVIKAWSRETCLVIPLTTSKRKNKFMFSVGHISHNSSSESQVILSQIRLIDTRRFEERISVLDKETFLEIKKAIKDLL